MFTTWEQVLRDRKTRRIKLANVVSYDSSYSDHYARQLEMTCDGIIGDAAISQGYCGQFFQDCRTYSLVEAAIYLENTVKDAKLMQSLQSLIIEIINKFDLKAV